MKMNTSKAQATANGKPKSRAVDRSPLAPPQEEITKEANEKLASEKKEEDSVWQPKRYTDLRDSQKGLHRGEYVIDGMLREGEFGLMGAVSKGSKSWAIGNLVWSVVTGGYWMGQLCKKGRVLLIDTELKEREIDYRLQVTADAMQYEPKPDDVIVVSLRGKTIDIHAIKNKLADMRKNGELEGVVLIIIDSIYKVMDGADEKNTGAVGQFVDVMIQIADEVALFGVHHATKGSQSDKRALDVFSGSGVIGRSLDLSVVIREHESPGLSVVDFDIRTSPGIKSVSAKFEWPMWYLVTTEPELKKTTGRSADNSAIERKILAAFIKAKEQGRLTLTSVQLRDYIDSGEKVIERVAMKLADEGKLTFVLKPGRTKNSEDKRHFSLVETEELT